MMSLLFSVRSQHLIRPYIEPMLFAMCIVAMLVMFMMLPWCLFCCRRRSPPTLPDTNALCKAYFLRARARLARGKIALAEADSKKASAYAEPEQLRQLDQFQKEIAKARQSNKRLSKEVAKWCEKAMAKAKPDAFSVEGLDEA